MNDDNEEKGCPFCALAKQLEQGSTCSGWRIGIMEAMEEGYGKKMDALNARLLEIEKAGASKEQIAELVAFIKDVSISAALAHAAKISVGKGDSLGDFVSEAAELWVDMRDEPARQVYRTFMAHINDAVVGSAAKAHSPNN